MSTQSCDSDDPGAGTPFCAEEEDDDEEEDAEDDDDKEEEEEEDEEVEKEEDDDDPRLLPKLLLLPPKLLLLLLLLLPKVLPPLLLLFGEELESPAARTFSECFTRSRSSVSTRIRILLLLLFPLPGDGLPGEFAASASALRRVASLNLFPSWTSRPSSSCSPVTRKFVRPLTEPVTFPPWLLMRSSTPSRLSETKVPVTTNVLPSRQPEAAEKEEEVEVEEEDGEGEDFLAGLFLGAGLAGLFLGALFFSAELIVLLLLLLLLLLLDRAVTFAVAEGDAGAGGELSAVFARFGDDDAAGSVAAVAFFRSSSPLSSSLRRL